MASRTGYDPVPPRRWSVEPIHPVSGLTDAMKRRSERAPLSGTHMRPGSTCLAIRPQWPSLTEVSLHACISGAYSDSNADKLLVTPFRSQNVPPPMSAYTISLPAVPVHVSVSSDEDALAVVFGDGRIQVWDLNTRIPDKGSSARGAPSAQPKLRSERTLELGGAVVKAVALGREDEVAVLGYSLTGGSQIFLSSADGKQEQRDVEGDIERLLWSSEKGWLVLDTDGMLRTGTSTNICHSRVYLC